jgi:NAD-reducing hydrogenase large subunit
MKRITIEPVSRIEGHARITIQLNDEGKVADTQFQVTQVRGFEQFTQGRPFYEMPGITSRICGICPISHQLASSKACDAIMAVRIPKTAKLLREVVHCAQFIQSHALSLFYLSGPDLLLGMNADPAIRNVAGLIEANPELARAGIELRKFGLTVIESLAEERVHASWIVPGGVKKPLAAQARDRILAGIPDAIAFTERAVALFRGKLDEFSEEIENFGSFETMYASLVDNAGN